MIAQRQQLVARTRMEGRLEVLEQSVVLLEFARAAVTRAAPYSDDLVTLRQLLAQWRLLEEALTMARRHEAARSTVLAIEGGMFRLSLAVDARLGVTSATMPEAIARILEQLASTLMPFTGRETLVMASPPPRVKALPIALFAGAGIGIVSSVPEAGLVASAAVWLGLSVRSTWLLTTDRLRLARPLRGVTDIPLRAVKQIVRHRQKLLVDGVALQTSQASELESTLRLLCTEWFIDSCTPCRTASLCTRTPRCMATTGRPSSVPPGLERPP